MDPRLEHIKNLMNEENQKKAAAPRATFSTYPDCPDYIVESKREEQAVPIKHRHPKWNRNGALCCPACGDTYLHHGNVVVYERSEDAPTTFVTSTKHHGTEVSEVASNETHNPSDRRHGLAIRFICELHPGEYELTFAQHKGETYTEWRYASPKK